MKRQFIFAMAMIVVSVFALTGCGGTTTGDNSKKPIVIGLDDNFPPMGYRDKNGQIVGFDIDLARDVAKKLNRPVEFKPIDWNAKEVELASGRIDAIWNGLSITPEREKKISFSTPYMKDEQIVVVLQNSPIQNLEDLKGKVVGVQNGSTSLAAFQSNKDIYDNVKNVKLYSDNVAALLDAKEERVDAVVVDSVVGRYYINSKPGVYRVLDQNFGKEDFAVGFAKNNQELRDSVNKALAELREDGTMKKISEKWFGADITQ